MANCFGEVIDNCYLDTLAQYVGKTKTRVDRAREAADRENEDGKNNEASNYVHEVRKWYGEGQSTLCLVYNATGSALRYVGEHDFDGSHVGRTPYPVEIGNGQWAAFQHVRMTGELLGGSIGAVIYRAKNKDGEERDVLLTWSTPVVGKNRAFSVLSTPDKFTVHATRNMWETIEHGIRFSAGKKHEVRWGGLHVNVSTASGNHPELKATIGLDI
uniref:Uncharacterized protein n=1 Tax=Leersia perrieri TaxID=77586 RepID=A0A0D9W3D6_9ORYZ